MDHQNQWARSSGDHDLPKHLFWTLEFQSGSKVVNNRRCIHPSEDRREKSGHWLRKKKIQHLSEVTMGMGYKTNRGQRAKRMKSLENVLVSVMYYF